MTTQVLRHDKRCRICGSDRIVTVLKLEDTPLEDQFIPQEKLHIEQPTYPLELALCEECGYVHLPHIVSPEASYANYIYVSGVTVGLRNHYDKYAQEIVSEYKIPQGSLVVDLGSNDGSMLSSFKKLGMRIVGVEPAREIADCANQEGLTTINDFFTEEIAEKIVRDYGQASVITANYMYANIDDAIAFTKAVAKLLAPEGIFVAQTGYHPEQMKIKMFDYIYHEHFSYFTVEVLKNIFSRCGLELIQAIKTSPKGGSLRAIGQLQEGFRSLDSSVERLIEEEKIAGMKNAETYQCFAREIENAKKKAIDLLKKIKESGKKIVGFGASHSTTTLMSHFEIAPFLEYLVDDNKLKQGLYSPGYHIPVYSTEKLSSDRPDYAIILAWQHGDTIIEKHRSFLESGGKFILPLPQLEIREYNTDKN
jgi:SAM-dependent methyltransferase